MLRPWIRPSHPRRLRKSVEGDELAFRGGPPRCRLEAYGYLALAEGQMLRDATNPGKHRFDAQTS